MVKNYPSKGTEMNVTSTPNQRRPRGTIVGVAAGVLAGGAIGLVAAVPSLTSAAADDAADEVVALQEDTTTDDGTTDEWPEPGERLRETLQPLVDDGTIDATQADAVTAYLIENRPERGDRMGHRGPAWHGRNGSVVADLLGIDQATLRSELLAGKSIADVAEANGVDIQTVIDAMIADAESHIELAIERGLDEDLAAERLERITERVTERVHNSRPADG
jgi:hypothetical protein